jgi:hypothetical protein
VCACVRACVRACVFMAEPSELFGGVVSEPVCVCARARARACVRACVRAGLPMHNDRPCVHAHQARTHERMSDHACMLPHACTLFAHPNGHLGVYARTRAGFKAEAGTSPVASRSAALSGSRDRDHVSGQPVLGAAP